MDALVIGIFAFIGGVSRYGIDQLVPTVGHLFPLATFMINFIGSFLLALLNTTWSVNERVSARISLGIGTGLIGAFTTFSSFSLEIFSLLAHQHYLMGSLYAVSSLGSGLVGALLGSFIGQKWQANKEKTKW